MSPLGTGGLGALALFILIFLRVPIAVAMTVVGLAGFTLQVGWGPALSLLSGDPGAYFQSLNLATIPLFLLMGTFAGAAGFSSDIYQAGAALLGHRRAGLAYATILGSAAFGAVCGSSAGTAATISKIALPEMLKRGYSPQLASGTVAAGGAFKSLLPPSLMMIVYCIIAKTYIFDLFLAAVIPAIITIALNLLAIAVVTRLYPSIAPVTQRLSWAERRAALRRAGPALALLIAVFGGLYSGIFTVNEAASVAAILSLLFALVRGRLTWPVLSKGLTEAAGVSVMIYFIIFGASVFTYFLTVGRIPDAFIHMIGGLNVPPVALIALLLLGYLALGTVFEEHSAVIVTLPLVLPIVVNAGYDPVWWGVMMVIQIELAMIHPPFGLIVFVIYGLAPDIPMRTIYLGLVPFLVADFLVLLMLTVFPDLATWLPRLING